MSLLPLGPDRDEGRRAARTLCARGDITPLLEFVERKLFPVFSNRDLLWLNEFAVKAAFTTLLFDDASYAIYSELELSRGHADLCLLLRPDARSYSLFDLLLEFKYVKPKNIGLEAEQLRTLNSNRLRDVPKIKKAIVEAAEQTERYRFQQCKIIVFKQKFGKP